MSQETWDYEGTVCDLWTAVVGRDGEGLVECQICWRCRGWVGKWGSGCLHACAG
jgi:hypothetical protein